MKKTINQRLLGEYLKLEIHTIGSFDSKVIKKRNVKGKEGDKSTIPTLITSTLF